MLLRFLGVIDILSALIIVFNIYHLHWIITSLHAIILFAKGGSSIFYDATGLVMGFVDIIAGIFIVFGIVGFLPIKIILFIFLVGKGAMSFL